MDSCQACKLRGVKLEPGSRPSRESAPLPDAASDFDQTLDEIAADVAQTWASA